jgi:outer membrane beta-barrel protein
MTSFTDDHATRGSKAPEAATALTLQWATTAGFEVTPIYGKFAFFEETMGQFGVVLTGGVGVGGSRVQIQGDSSENGATYGDTGVKFLGEIGAGFRVYLTKNLLARIEMRDLIYTAKVDKVNGCTAADLDKIQNEITSGLSASCEVDAFEKNDAFIAKGYVKSPSSDVLNNVGVYGGVSYAF